MNSYIKGFNQTTGIRYISFGHGPKIMVIIPGLSIGYVTDNATALTDAFSDFTEDFTIYLFDIKENVPENYSINRMGDDLTTTIKDLRLENIYLYGCSMGGMQAMYIAGKYPELIKKLVVISSACKENLTSKETINNWINLAKNEKCNELTTDMGQRIYSKQVFEECKSMFSEMASNLTKESLRRFINTASAISGFDISATTELIKCPVLVIGSKGDHVLTPEASTEIANLTGGELYLYDLNTSHAIYDEIPELKTMAKEFFLKKIPD